MVITDDSSDYTVSTFVGNGDNGDDPVTNGPALLWVPGDIVFDAAGNLFVADGYNDKIKKITPDGMMTTLAGSSVGYADGTGSQAQFAGPGAMAIDAHGNLFVAEFTGLRVRKVTPEGVVTTIAGNGTAGLVDGVGDQAQINIVGGIVINSEGTIYFTQDNFHGVRQILPSGEVSTFVGSSSPGFAEGDANTARFNEPYIGHCDAQGNIYVFDRENARIRKISPAGIVSTVLTRNKPEEIGIFTIDKEGNYFLTPNDNINSEIVKYDVTGHSTKIAGGALGYEDGLGNLPKFSYASGLTTDANGDLFFRISLTTGSGRSKRITNA